MTSGTVGQSPKGAGYAMLDDEEEMVPSRGASGDDDISRDLAVARALQEEEERAAGRTLDGGAIALDEEFALSLAMEDDGMDSAPSPPPRPQENLAPLKQSVDIAGAAQSMLDKLVSTFRGPSSEDIQRTEERRFRVEQFKKRRSRQATLVLNSFEVLIPTHSNCEDFLIMTPNGKISQIHVPEEYQRQPFYVTYDGEQMIKAPPRILDEAEQSEAFLDFYRFNPVEVETEVEIIPGPRPLGGLELISQPEGVFVKWGILPLMSSREHSEVTASRSHSTSTNDSIPNAERYIRAGDLIVQVGGNPIATVDSLKHQLASYAYGTKVAVRVLRKPTPVVCCPMGHALSLDGEQARYDAECGSCRVNFGRHHCHTCGFSLCWPCFDVIYSHSKARFPSPVNNDYSFTEAPRSSRLTSSVADVGTRLLIYWYTTAEWWIGSIESFDKEKGYTIVYEERNGGKCREIIPDLRLREYRILTHSMLLEDLEKMEFSGETPGQLLTSARAPVYESKTEPLLTFDDLQEDEAPQVQEHAQVKTFDDEEKESAFWEEYTPLGDNEEEDISQLKKPSPMDSDTVTLDEAESVLVQSILGDDFVEDFDDEEEIPP